MSRRRSASSSATPAWAANEATTSAAACGNGSAPCRRPMVSTPRTLPGAPSGNTTAGPRWPIAPRAASAVRSSAAKSATACGSPVSMTRPDSDRPAGRTKPSAASAPSPWACSITSRFLSCSGRASTARSALDSSSACVVTAARTWPGSAPDSSRLVISPLATSQRSRCRAYPGRGGHCRSPHQRRQRVLTGRLVLGVELPAAALLGQVQVAEDHSAHPDRHAEEAVHRRVPRGESRPTPGAA